MKARENNAIPAFLSIDVEPDAFQVSRDHTQKWSGYGAVFDLSLTLREELSVRSGVKPHFGWYYRMDPQIEEVCGRADAAMTSFPQRTQRLRDEGDYFGVHSHPLRWSAKHRLWVHDFGDRAWLRECTEFSLDAFERCNGSQPQVYRAGASFLNNDIIEVLDDHGVALERGEFRRIGSNGDARRLLLIPLSTGARTLPSWRSKIRQRLRATPEPDRVEMLYPTIDWPSERYFWDVVSHQLQSMERPYLSLAIRTDPPDSLPTAKLRRLFRALVKHPLAKRLRFVNPVHVAEAITPAQYS
jgi:hypothetical protein